VAIFAEHREHNAGVAADGAGFVRVQQRGDGADAGLDFGEDKFPGGVVLLHKHGAAVHRAAEGGPEPGPGADAEGV